MTVLGAATGFDPRILPRLPAATRGWLAALGALNLAAAALVAVGAGSVARHSFGSAAVAVGAGVAVGAFWLNILRLTIAAGALAPHLPPAELRRWRAPAAPLLFFGLFGVCFAQPLLALVRQQPLEALWRQPLVAAASTLGLAAVIAGGALVRAAGVRPVRDYEALRHADERAFILAAHSAHRRAMAAAFEAATGRAFAPDEPYEDPPFNQRLRGPRPRGQIVAATAEDLRRALGRG